MYNPELITAYVIAGSISSLMLFTAFKIVRHALGAPQPARRTA